MTIELLLLVEVLEDQVFISLLALYIILLNYINPIIFANLGFKDL